MPVFQLLVRRLSNAGRPIGLVPIAGLWATTALAGIPKRPAPSVDLTIQRAEREGSSVKVTVGIANRGTVPVFLLEDGTRSLQLELWREGEGWIYVGPIYDTHLESASHLSPGEMIERHVHAVDPYPEMGPGKSGLITIQGKLRVGVVCFRREKDAKSYRRSF